MAYNQDLAQKIIDLLDGIPGITEKKMFGGIGFLLNGNMICGVNKQNLIVRVGPDQYDNSLKLAHVQVFDFSGRPMSGWVSVSEKGYERQSDLKDWITKGIKIASSLPPK